MDAEAVRVLQAEEARRADAGADLALGALRGGEPLPRSREQLRIADAIVQGAPDGAAREGLDGGDACLAAVALLGERLWNVIATISRSRSPRRTSRAGRRHVTGRDEPAMSGTPSSPALAWM
jgi:hypothetical protein